ncbi:MAG TPA: hypothetical protein VHA73_09540 [Acidimicrobiales bacterium]|nr:hypothetical protein [Acidimicrobiales bacterium]
MVAAIVAAAILAGVRAVRRRSRVVVVKTQVEPIGKAQLVWSQALNRPIDDEDLRCAAEHLGPGPLYESLRGRGSVDYLTTKKRLLVRSIANEPVLIRDAWVAILQRQPPITKTLVTSPDAGAHVATWLLFDLDDDEPEAWEGRQDGAISRIGDLPLFYRQHFSLQPGETEDFLIKADVSQTAVDWVLYLRVEHRGRSREVTVYDVDGGPFRTSGCAPDSFDEIWGAGVMASPDEPLRRVDPDIDY